MPFKCFSRVLLIEESALVKPFKVGDDGNDYILFVCSALSLPKYFSTYFLVVW
jgi:hypothetical protein